MPPAYAPAKIHRPNQSDADKIRNWIAGLQANPSIKLVNHSGKKTNSDNLSLKNDIEMLNAAVASQSSSLKNEESRLPTTAKLLDKIKAYLESKPAEKQQVLRFFVFRNLAQLQAKVVGNQAERSAVDTVGQAQSALVKALNSLSWNTDFATIEEVDGTDGLVMSVDITTLRNRENQLWTEDIQWASILDAYPYGYEFNVASFARIQELTGSGMPIVRGDWFIATTLRPPLYHELLQIPEDVKELESFLGVDVEQNILKGRAVRSGFTNSLVSQNANRLIERHASRDGYYWKSYDFLATAKKSNIIRFPVGPEFADNPFNSLAFTHDGGEIIFSLPNGLQGYMLVNRLGKRINEGPGELVSDFNQVSGSPLIVNGLSCIACHSQGLIPAPRDEVLARAKIEGKVRQFVERLHPEGMPEVLLQDQRKFMFSLEQVLRPWASEVKKVSVVEPVGVIAKQFLSQPLGLHEIAAELDVSAEELRNQIQYNDKMRGLGLLGLVEGGIVKREDWQKRFGLQTAFQSVVREVGLGTPWKQAKAGKDK
jgi:serine/threonine-protein kinase